VSERWEILEATAVVAEFLASRGEHQMSGTLVNKVLGYVEHADQTEDVAKRFTPVRTPTIREEQ